MVISKNMFVAIITTLIGHFVAYSTTQAVILEPGDIVVSDVDVLSGTCVGGPFDGMECSLDLECEPDGTCLPNPSIIHIDPVTGTQTIITTGGHLVRPRGVAFDSNGDILVADDGLPGVIRVDPATGVQTVVSSGGNMAGGPSDLSEEADGKILVVVVGSPGKLVRVDPSIPDDGVGGNQTLITSAVGNRPSSIDIDANGKAIIGDNNAGPSGSGAVIRIDPDIPEGQPGHRTVVTSNDLLGGAPGITIDFGGDYIVLSLFPAGVVRVDPSTGSQTLIVVDGFTDLGGHGNPLGIDIESTGDFVVAAQGGGVVRVDPGGNLTTVSSGGLLTSLDGIAVVPGVTETCLLAGDKDSFASSGDAADAIVVRPQFEAWLSDPGKNNCAFHGCQILPFDTLGPLNWDFGYTFLGLPRIASASLEVHLRGSASPGNDAIFLQFVQPVSPRFGWLRSLADMDAFMGGDGVFSPNEDLTIVVDLSALPLQGGGTLDLIPDINSKGYLDVSVWDDTAIDYVELCYVPADCNGNGFPDTSDIAIGAADFNQNGVLDVCEPFKALLEPGTESCPSASPSECGGCGHVPLGWSDSVNRFSGEYIHTVADLRIAGREMDFAWQRKYRSRVGPSTTGGNGWDLAYDVRLIEVGAALELHDGQGRRDRYVPQGDDTWGSDQFFRLINQNPDSTYTATFENTGTWTFNPFDASPAAGKIQSITDRNGNTLGFGYDMQGRLVTVTDTLNRDIQIGYDANGNVASITDFIGRQTSYEYYLDGDAGGSSGDLKSFTTPTVNGTPNGNDFLAGKTTVYTYTTGFADDRLNHDLLTVTDPKGQTYLQNTYAHTISAADPRFTIDPNDIHFDRIVRQIHGDPGDIIDFFYVSTSPEASNNFAVLMVIENDRVGNVTEFFYDGENREVMRREYTGRADPDLVTTEAANRPSGKLRATDPGFFETRFAYNTDAKVTRIDHPNGNVTINVYELDLDPNAPRRSRGNLREVHRLPGPLGGDQAEIIEFFEYDDGFGGCCGTNFITRHVDGRGNETLHTYDPNGNRLHTQHRIPSIVEDFEYNAFGQMTSHTLPDNGSAHRRRDEFTYYVEADGPQFGYRKNAIVDAGGGLFNLTTTYEYDAVGNVTRTIDPEGHDRQYVYNELDQVVRSISAEVAPGGGVRYERDTFYDANDNVVRVDIQNKDETGALQANTHFTNVYEYEILNYRIRACEEVGNFTGAIPGPTNLPTCVGLPAADFITTEYAYDANRNPILIRYGEAAEGRQPANVVETLYDERDLTFRQIRAPGEPGPGGQSTSQYDYDQNRNIVRTQQGIESAPRITSYTYDGYDRLVSTTDPMGNVTPYGYDANHNRVGLRTDGELLDLTAGGAGNIRLTETAYEYDPLDRVTRQIVQFFDTASQAAINTGPRPPDGAAVTDTEWSDNSQVLRVLDDNNHQTLTVYDTANRILTVTDAENNVIAYAYDDDSLVTAVTETEKSQLGNPDELFTTTNAYDGLHRLTSTVDNVGNTHTFAHDSRNNQTVVIDALNNETRYAYDGINRLTATIRDLDDDGADGDGPDITITQVWDDDSRLTEQADDNGNATTSVYDPLNRKIAKQMADCTQHTYAYDVHDNRLTVTDANGSVATCTYDLLDRLVQKDIVPGAGVSSDTLLETYQFDGLSRPVAAEDDDSAVTRSYDSLSRVTTETLTIARGQVDETSGTTICLYDGVGNELESTYPGGRFITCTYDNLDRKQLIADETGPPTTIATYSYVGPGRVERRDYGNGTRTDFDYDGILPNPPGDFGLKNIVCTTHLEISSGTIIDQRTYAWDRMFNKTQRKDIRAGGPQLTHDYAYDDIYRLTLTTVTDSMLSVVRTTDYALDGVGNRETVTGSPDSGMYAMVGDVCTTPADQDINQYSTTPFDSRQYDENGNLTASLECIEGDVDGDQILSLADMAPFVAVLLACGPVSCEVDLSKDGNINGLDIQPFIDRLLGLTSPTPLYEVTYDYRNQMVEHNDPGSGQRHTYAYDVHGRRIARVVDADGVAGGPTETRYFYDGWQVCEEQDAAGTTRATSVYGRYIDDVLNMQRSIGISPVEDFFYHTDDLYNVMAVTDSIGIVVERYEYQDYGDPEFFDGTGAPIAGTAIDNPYLFTGRRYDPETGWYYYRTRYLDPLTGRFTSRDTIGIWGDMLSVGNGSTYVGGNPQTQVDAFGMIIVVVMEDDGECLGACGPGCDWCLCGGGSCLCTWTLACEIHDRCCDDWCGPCDLLAVAHIDGLGIPALVDNIDSSSLDGGRLAGPPGGCPGIGDPTRSELRGMPFIGGNDPQRSDVLQWKRVSKY